MTNAVACSRCSQWFYAAADDQHGRCRSVAPTATMAAGLYNGPSTACEHTLALSNLKSEPRAKRLRIEIIRPETQRGPVNHLLLYPTLGPGQHNAELAGYPHHHYLWHEI